MIKKKIAEDKAFNRKLEAMQNRLSFLKLGFISGAWSTGFDFDGEHSYIINEDGTVKQTNHLSEYTMLSDCLDNYFMTDDKSWIESYKGEL